MIPVHIIFSSSLVPTFVVLFLAPFFLFAVLWAIFRLPKLRSTISKLRRHRRELEARRAELASVALELKQKRGADKTPKQPYVLEAENVVEEVPERPALTINPFLLMLVKPAASIRQVVDFDSQLHVILLSCLYGVNALLRLNDGIRNLQLSYVVLLPTALIAGPIVGLFSVSLVSWFARIISDGLDGAATEHETQASLAWSLLPEIYTLPLTLLMAIIAAPDTGSSNASLVRAVMIWHLAVSSAARAWSLVLWIFALAEVNRFSRWRALAAVLVTTFALVVAAVLVIAAFFLFGILLGG